MRRMRSKLNNLVYPSESGVNSAPAAVHGVGLNRQTSAIQSQLQAVGIHPQQMMPEMYDPSGYPQSHAQQAYPHMQPGMQPGMAPQMQMPQQIPMAQPMMYPAAQQQMPAMAQTAQPMADAGMDHVRAGLEQLSENIQQLAAANNAVGGQDASQVQKQNEMITAELMELRKQIAMTSEQAGHQDLASQMEAIRHAIEAAMAKSTNPDAFASAVEVSHKKISDELYEFKNALSNNNSNPEVFAHTFEARHDEISRSINDLQHSINAAIGNPGLYAETVENSHRELSQQFEDFKQTMTEQSAANQQVDMPDFSALEMRLEEITRAIVALSTANQGQDGLDRIEARISDLAKTISTNETTVAPAQMADYDDHFNQVHHNLQLLDTRLSELQPGLQSDTGSLDLQIKQISDKMDALSDANQHNSATSLQSVGGLEENMKLLSEKLENLATTSTANAAIGSGENVAGVDNSALIGRLDDLVGEVVHLRSDSANDQAMADRMSDLVTQLESFSGGQASDDGHTNQIIAHLKDLSQSVDKLAERGNASGQNGDFSSLEAQLTQITQKLGEGGEGASVGGLPIEEISQRLTGIEQQIGASRDIAIELASQAATEAVQRTISEAPAGEGSDGSTLLAISENIQNLNEHTAAAHAQFIEQFDTVKSSLMELTGRNNQLEDRLDSIKNDENTFADSSDVMQQQLVSEPAFVEPQNSTLEVQVQSEPHVEENYYQDEVNHEEINLSNESTEGFAQQQQPETQNSYDVEHIENDAEPLTSDMPIEVLADEYSHTADESQTGGSTADLINKIRENARAEQIIADSAEAAENSHQQAELVLAQAVGKTLDPQETLSEAATQIEAHPENAAQQSYEAQLTQEVNPVYEGVASRDALSTPEIAQELQASTPLLADEPVDMHGSPHDDLQNMAHQNQLPQVDVPSLDVDHDDDLPLEPGSAGPDLAALVRQVNERRMESSQNNLGASGSDFLASARRAAQAAAQEANMVEEEIEQTEKKGLFASLPELLAKKKKLLMIGVVAVAVIAIAIPFLSSSPNAPSEEVVIEQSDNSQIAEPAEPAETAETAEDGNAVFSDEPISEGEDNAALETEIQDVSEAEGVDESIVAPANAAEIGNEVDTVQSAEPETTPAETYDVSQLGFVTPELRDAVSQGNLTAIFEVGRRYTNGEGTKKDLKEAATWYERAAKLGYAPAQYIFGNFNEKGYGMEPNIETAVNWYKKSADQGNIIAMHNLGVIYATPGKLNEQADMTQAFNWFNKAADHGVRDSQVNMGIFHTKGFGTEVDLAKAYKWLSIASADGDADAKSKVSFIEERLRPEQLVEAKELVENWKPSKVVTAVNEVMIPDSWKIQAAAMPLPKIDKKTIQQTQAVLNKLGYKAGTPDGIMGNQTKQAISKYQQTEGLSVTGTINPELVKSLIAKMSG